MDVNKTCCGRGLMKQPRPFAFLLLSVPCLSSGVGYLHDNLVELVGPVQFLTFRSNDSFLRPIHLLPSTFP